jgi:Fic family protein
VFISQVKMNVDPKTPHNALPDLPPAENVETVRVLKAVIGAREELARVRDACAALPNGEVLMNTLPVLEARDSSKIENILTTADELFRYDGRKPDEGNGSAKEANNYCTALRRGWELLRSGRPLCVNTALAIAEALQGAAVSVRSHGVTLSDSATGAVHYTPPDGEEVLWRKLRNWETFLNASDGLDPLVRLAIAHYQFEAIHPFRDGNGRTGRIINLLLLVRDGFLSAPVVYLSRHILRERGTYYRLLRRVSFDGDWESWILFMLGAIRLTSSWTAEKIRGIRTLMVETGERLRRELPKLYSQKLLNVLFAQPYCRIRSFVDSGIARRQTAAKYIGELVAAGFLGTHSSDGVGKLYVNEPFWKELIRDSP